MYTHYILYFCMFYICYSAPDVSQGKMDISSYKYFSLNNNLQVILVNDYHAKLSSISMDVSVGYSSDSVSGLAHLTEHMLFLGTKQYPKEDYFSNFVSSNGGSSNAFTSIDNTNYYYSIKHNTLEKSLEIFSTFFSDPLLNKSSIDREISAVDSEHSKNIPNDSWRLLQLLKHFANKDHPFANFGTGNKDTLKSGDKLYNALTEFHKKHYYAENMRLAIITKFDHYKQMEDFETIVKKIFSKIPSKNLKSFPAPYIDQDIKPQKIYNLPTPFNITVDLIEMTPTLSLLWEISPLYKRVKEGSLSYLSYLLDSSYTNGLYDTLKRKEYIISVSVDVSPATPSYSLLTIDFRLTNIGYNHINEIISNTLYMLKLISQKGISESRYKEIQSISQLDFDLSTSAPTVSSLSEGLRWYRPKDLLIDGSLLQSYSYQHIFDFINSLSYDKMIIVIGKHDLDKSGSQQENIYGTHYYSGPIKDEKLINNWKNICCNSYSSKGELLQTNSKKHGGKCRCTENFFKLTPHNPYFPLDISYPSTALLKLKAFDENPLSPPEVIFDKTGLRGWYKEDTKYLDPTSNLHCHLYLPTIDDDDLHHLYATILLSMVDDLLEPRLFDANSAHYSYDMKMTHDGINIGFDGFYSKFTNYLNTVFNYLFYLSNSKDNQDEHSVFTKGTSLSHSELFSAFSRAKSTMLLSFQNQKYQAAYSQANYLLKRLVLDNFYDIDTLQFLLHNITFNEVISFHESLFKEFNFECFIHSSIDKSEATVIFNFIYGIINSRNNFHIISSDRIPISRLIMVPKPKLNYYLFNSNPSDNNHCYLSYYQLAPSFFSDNKHVKHLMSNEMFKPLLAHSPNIEIMKSALLTDVTLEVLEKIIDKHFFHTLRTKLQLGYVVFSNSRIYNHVPGFMFLIQSTVADPIEIDKHISDFVKSMFSILQKFDKKDFNNVINSIIDKKKRIPSNMASATSFFYSSILNEHYLFDHNLIEIHILKSLKVEDIIELYKELILNNPNVLTSNIYNKKNHKDIKENYSLASISKISQFKNTHSYYPDYHPQVYNTVYD